MERARGCFRHLKSVFQELEEIRPFELLKGQGDRINYLMSKQVGRLRGEGATGGAVGRGRIGC